MVRHAWWWLDGSTWHQERDRGQAKQAACPNHPFLAISRTYSERGAALLRGEDVDRSLGAEATKVLQAWMWHSFSPVIATGLATNMLTKHWIRVDPLQHRLCYVISASPSKQIKELRTAFKLAYPKRPSLYVLQRLHCALITPHAGPLIP